MGRDAFTDAQDEAWDKGHADGYDEGHEQGYCDALEEMLADPAILLRALQVYQWQDWFDRLKAEAARLGVRV